MESLMTLTKTQYATILKLLCPYCAVGLPDTFNCNTLMNYHSIPLTDFRADCEANKIRNHLGVFEVVPDEKP